MLFTSLQYIFFFLPILLLLVKYLSHLNFKYILSFLIFSSLYFYSVWDIRFLFLLIFSILFNFFVGKNILNTKNKKSYLYIGIIINVSILAYFKYKNFIIENTNVILSSNFDISYIIFPLALSFYTIQQIAFLVDCYDEKIKELNFTTYALFISFFPQLIAGPIVLYKDAYYQYKKETFFENNFKNLYLGIIIFSIGISKKILLADTFSIPVNEAFGQTYYSWQFIDAWIASILFTMQIYFDFSGYTDMAIGAALLFNIYLPINFNSPLKSTSIISFWQKWHMTLSNFINQYCFYKIIKKFHIKNTSFQYFIILFVMTVAGLWHGPTWGFVMFGVVHGIALIINHIWKSLKLELPNIINWFFTFIVVNIGFVFFRSPNLDISLSILKKMFDPIGFKNFILQVVNFKEFNIYNISGITTFSPTVFYTFVISLLIIFLCKNSSDLIKNYKFKIYHLFFYSFILVLSILRIRGVEFIYFEF